MHLLIFKDFKTGKNPRSPAARFPRLITSPSAGRAFHFKKEALRRMNNPNGVM